MNAKREYGDYQTPLDFAEQICLFLKNEKNIHPAIIIEPTCGVGNFIKACLIFDSKSIVGIDINHEHCEKCRKILDKRISIIHSDIFSYNTKNMSKGSDQTLIIGNPPWINNATLSVLESNNTPVKKNFKSLKGMDALTGASNFDICEYIILKLIDEHKNSNTVIAMLCKTSVARNVFQEIKRTNINFSLFEIYTFDAKSVFDISASACLMILKLTNEHRSPDKCDVYSFYHPKIREYQFGYVDGSFRGKIVPNTCDYDGNCCFEWRQGVKHDCSKVMELEVQGNDFINGNGEKVDIENNLVYPLVKSSMYKTPVIDDFKKFVLITQKHIKDDTSYISEKYPRTWAYLTQHNSCFEKRKSSIYRNSPAFSMFGLGDYSFGRYKVGISGFYKKPFFSLMYSHDNKPVMTDDTSYFLCFDNYDMAYVAMLILNSESVSSFLKDIAFLDSKRPYTKKILKRIDFHKIIAKIELHDLLFTESSLCLKQYITHSMYEQFRALPELSQLS